MRLPHLKPFARQPLVFLTCCTHERRALLAEPQAHDILRKIWETSAALDGWFVGRYLLMPDHAHLFAKPAVEAKPLPGWMKTWKSISSRQFGWQRRVAPPVWQCDYFDHFIRSAASYAEKWHYVENNPVRGGLCAEAADWLYKGEIHELTY